VVTTKGGTPSVAMKRVRNELIPWEL